MKPRWNEVGWASVTFLVLVALPLVLIMYLPQLTTGQFTFTGIDIRGILSQTIIIGIVITAISLAKAFVEKASISNLILGISSEVVSVVFALMMVGVGNIESLGMSSFSLTRGKLTTAIALDLRIFVLITLAILGVSVVHTVVRFREARTARAAALPK